MAWATKYQFKFNSSHGVEHRILIQKDGYSGGIIKRSLGRGPVLKKQKNGPICGTSLEIYAECTIDGEFAQDFFTSNPKDLRVRLYRGNNLIWTGFVSAETYSEPNIAPPYDVQIVATDGLGELKLVTFVPAGAVTLSEHFRTALSYAGEGHTIYVASALIMTGQATTATFGMSINLDYLADKSYYDVLTALLDSLHATITMYNGNWLIARETDLSSLLSGSGLSVVQIAANGTVSTTTLAGVAKTVGSLADNMKDTWPVGYLSTAIEPARREVTVEAPWHTVSGPADPSMEATTGSPWTTEGQVTHNTTDDCYYELGLNQSDPTDRTWGTIKQEIPINKLDCGFELKLRVSPRVYKLRQGDTQWYARGLIKVHLEYDLTVTQTTPHTTTYIGTEEGWSGAPRAESDPSVDIPVTELDSIGERWLSVDIPAIATPDSSSRYLVSDTAVVRIVIEGYWVDVYECIITPTLDLPGYQDVITINNGARGAENAVEITGGRVRSGNLVNNMFYGGIWLYGGVPVTSFADSQNQGGDFLAIAALSYASSVANARLRTEGSINVPADFANLPLFLTVEDVPAWLETWDWDLLGDEVQLSLLSLPANQITVESETVTGLPEGYSGGSGRGSGSGSSAASSYSYKSGGSNYFEEDGEGGIRLKDDYNGLTIPGFIKSTGDQIVIDGDPGGGGGGGGVQYLHELLDVDIDDETIVPGQILVWDGEKWVNEDPPEGSVTSVALAQGDANGTFHLVVNGVTGTDVPVKGLDDSLSVISQALQSFQSQIDAVSARDMFDELTATVVSSDVLTATEVYIGYAHASRYYLTDSIYFWAESVNGVMCVRLNAPLITAGDQIVISGTPGGGGGGGASYLDELLDVTITLPSNGQTLFYQDGIWVNGNIDFSNYYTKAQVDNIIGTIQQFHYEVYASLEDVTDPQNNVLYLIGPTGSGEDKYEEYVYSGGWVKIGDTSIDLSGYVQTNRLDADEAIIAEAIQSLQSQIDAVSARDNYDELTASALYADMLSATYAYAERYYLTDGVFFYIETVNGIPCVKLNAPFITEGDQIIISGTPGGGGGGGITLYDYDQVKAMTADVALTAPSAWAMHQMWAEIFGGASSVLTSGNYTNYVNTTNFPGLNKVGTVTSVATGTGLTGGPITASGTISIDPTYLGYISHGETAYGWGDILTQAIQSLQSQVDSVSARNNYDELTVTVLFADTLSATSAYIGNITGHLSGNADTASHLIGSSYAVGSATQPVYFSGGLPVSCTYTLNASILAPSAAGRLAYYSGANAVSDYWNTIGSATKPMYLNAGVPTACTYALNAGLLASSTAGRLAYYSGTNAVSEYYGNIGSGVIPMYLNAGVPTASTSTVGSASLPVYLNAGTITACTAASLFSALGSNTVNNLEVTVAGQLRTITNLYATYDGAGENISDKFTIVSSAIQSLQSQIDSVATRFGTDECIATTAYFDMLSVGAYIYAGALITTGDQTVASDATLKKNWRRLNYGIEDIARATAGVFDWKDGHGTSAGTIAQEWKDLIPELVHGEEGGMSLAYGQAAMLNTILLARHETEQDREIRQLKARVFELETRLKIRS